MTMERSVAYGLGYDEGIASKPKDPDKYPGQTEDALVSQVEYEEGHDDGSYERIRSQGGLRRSPNAG